MSAVKAEHVKTARDKIQTGGSRFLYRHTILSAIFQNNAPGDDIRILQYAIQKRRPHAAHLVFQTNFKSLRLPCVSIDCRQSRQPILPFFDLVSDIA